MVAKTQLFQFFAGFFAAMTIAGIYLAAKQLYIPIFGITAGPLLFTIFTIVSILIAAILLWLSRK
jgi:hypothetical protein